MSLKQSSCDTCTWCKYKNNEGRDVQIGCRAGQLDKYLTLKSKVDPNGLSTDNSVMKLQDGENNRYWVINYPCIFQRKSDWEADNCDPAWTEEELREFLIKITPFDYALVVISDGNTKHTIKTCKSVINATVPPVLASIVYPYKFLVDKNKEELFLALQDRMSKGDITKPDIWYGFDIRQIVNPEMDTIYHSFLDAVKAKKGFFYILCIQAGSKVDPCFIESIKRLVLNLEIDFHIISLDKEEALMIAPVFMGLENAEFAPSAAFQYKDGKVIQKFDINYLKNFIKISQ